MTDLIVMNIIFSCANIMIVTGIITLLKFTTTLSSILFVSLISVLAITFILGCLYLIKKYMDK